MTSDLCQQSLYPADFGGGATLSPDGRGPPRPEGTCSVYHVL